MYKFDCVGDSVICVRDNVCTWGETKCVCTAKRCVYVVAGICWSCFCLYSTHPGYVTWTQKGQWPKMQTWSDWVLYNTRVPWGSMQAQTPCQPIHKQEDEESRTNSPSFLALKDYLVWPLLSFLVLFKPHTTYCGSMLTSQMYLMGWGLDTIWEVLARLHCVN